MAPNSQTDLAALQGARRSVRGAAGPPCKRYRVCGHESQGQVSNNSITRRGSGLTGAPPTADGHTVPQTQASVCPGAGGPREHWLDLPGTGNPEHMSTVPS